MYKSLTLVDKNFLLALAAAGVLALPIVAITMIVRLLLGGVFEISAAIALWIIAALLPVLSRYGSPYRFRRGNYGIPWVGVAIFLCAIVTLVAYSISHATWLAWGALFAGWSGLFFAGDLFCRSGKLYAALTLFLVTGFGGAMPVLVNQIEARFAEEEFFVALQGVVLAVFIAGVWLSYRALAYYLPRPKLRGVTLPRPAVLMVLALAMFFVGCLAVRAYQHSFYSRDIATYPGISPETPFVCNETPATSVVYDGVEVFNRLLGRVEANPRKGTLEYGMLALATGEQQWAEQFRISILHEAAAGRFTHPANSVKYGQYEAAHRAYYFPRVVRTFPQLFSAAEIVQLETWFAAINKRAMTVEWVDTLYALAFTKWPEGPYENQENGAALLALLESEGLAASGLHEANRNYLLRNQRGWNERFRNTDDALVYQLEWINNAYYQSLYQPTYSRLYQQQSFEWLLLQALSDGDRLGYNHVGRPSFAGVAYLGATLLNDPRYVWLSGRALDVLEAREEYLGAQPGVEFPVTLLGHSPTSGSCLLYGDSGLPNQVGPLAPDKIVLRDGWTEDALYILLNLRFTGWHRYKAPNTFTLIYQNTALIGDVAAGQPFDWLPVGRSLFRDKRIPRENLNGLLIPRVGLGAVLQTLSGIGSPWAQDPPHYARVENFQIAEEFTRVHTRLENWHGWQHDRHVQFYHDEMPVIILDAASGPENQSALITWHLADGEWLGDNRLSVQLQASTIEIVWVPLGDQAQLFWERQEDGSLAVRCTGQPGALRWAMVLLRDDWLGAEVIFDQQTESLHIGQLLISLAEVAH